MKRGYSLGIPLFLFLLQQLIVLESSSAQMLPSRIEDAGQIVGRVVNTCGPSSGIWVYIPGRSFVTKTGVDGAFVFHYVPQGVYDVVIEAPTHMPQAIHGVQVTRQAVTDVGQRTIPDLSSDPHSCGACTRACGPGQHCINGTCGIGTGASSMQQPTTTQQPLITCGQPGVTICGGTCVNLSMDVRNCGTCGRACLSGQACINGQCTSQTGQPLTQPSLGTCVPGQIMCAGLCADPSTDIRNCGSCGTMCPAVANGTAACMAGKCTRGSCNAGFADCDMLPTNGCETNVMTSVMSCGTCGRVCPAGPNTAASACINGTCIIGACAAGFADCNKNPVDGCETNLSSVANCGACGRACAPGRACVSGVCQ